MGINKCVHLKQFMMAQSEVIQKHIDEHKWFNHIEDYNSGVCDFIKKYGWLMREMYCNHSCPYREDCEIRAEMDKSMREGKNYDI